MRMSPEKMKKVLDGHAKWLAADPAGVRANLARADLTGIDLVKVDLTRADLEGAILTGGNLAGVNFERAILVGADLVGACLNGARLHMADFSRARLSGATLKEADLTAARFAGADLANVNLTDADLSRACFDGAHFDVARFFGANLDGANFRGVDISRVDLEGARLGADFMMPDGKLWSVYLRDIVPALLTAGGKSLREVLETGCWSCHSWSNCPMHAAFGISSSLEAPVLLQSRVQEFVRLFDSGLIPRPDLPAAESDPSPVPGDLGSVPLS